MNIFDLKRGITADARNVPVVETGLPPGWILKVQAERARVLVGSGVRLFRFLFWAGCSVCYLSFAWIVMDHGGSSAALGTAYGLSGVGMLVILTLGIAMTEWDEWELKEEGGITGYRHFLFSTRKQLNVHGLRVESSDGGRRWALIAVGKDPSGADRSWPVYGRRGTREPVDALARWLHQAGGGVVEGIQHQAPDRRRPLRRVMQAGN